MIPPFKWIKTFMNTPQEWHAAVEGFCDGFLLIFPWVSKHKPNEELTKAICGEHHYYSPGLVLGVMCLILFSIGIYTLVT